MAALCVLVVGVVLAAAIALVARRRPIHPGDAAFEAHLAELDTGAGWLPPPGWEAEQARVNAEHSAGCQHRTCTGCGWAFAEHVFAAHVRGRCPGGDHDDTFTAHRIDQHKETEMKRFPFKLTEFLQESDHERYQAAVAEDNAKREAEARAWQQAEREAKAARKQGR